jgi:hypothetical protein
MSAGNNLTSYSDNDVIFVGGVETIDLTCDDVTPTKAPSVDSTRDVVAPTKAPSVDFTCDSDELTCNDVLPTQAPSVDSTRWEQRVTDESSSDEEPLPGTVSCSKRPRSDDDEVVSESKRSTPSVDSTCDDVAPPKPSKSPLFDSESSDDDKAPDTSALALQRQAPTQEPQTSFDDDVNTPQKKVFRRTARDLVRYNDLADKLESLGLASEIYTPFSTFFDHLNMCELYKALGADCDDNSTDDEGEDVLSNDDDTDDDVDIEANSDDEAFINDGHISSASDNNDGDIPGEEGINTFNIISGKRTRRATTFYSDPNLRNLLLADVPFEERGAIFGSSIIDSDSGN